MLRKTLAIALTGSALTVISTHASAISLLPTLTYDGSTAVSVSNSTAVKNWADMIIDLGWMHTTRWYPVQVTQASNIRITLTDASKAYSVTASNGTTGNTTLQEYSGNSINPAFSLWSFAGTPGPGSSMVDRVNNADLTSPLATHYDGTGTQQNDAMGFNQVAAPSETNNSRFLAGGGVNGFVGYANAGDTFVNGNGDAVGHGSAGSAFGAVAGHKYASLDLYGLPAGYYLLGLGGSCVNLTNCGVEMFHQKVYNTATGALVRELFNPGNAWGSGQYKLTIEAAPVPLPAAVWLLGSALAGMGIFGRRKGNLGA